MMKIVNHKFLVMAGVLLSGLSSDLAYAAETDKTKLAKAAQYPIASMTRFATE